MQLPIQLSEFWQLLSFVTCRFKALQIALTLVKAGFERWVILLSGLIWMVFPSLYISILSFFYLRLPRRIWFRVTIEMTHGSLPYYLYDSFVLSYLKKMVVQNIENESGTGCSVKKIKLQMSLNCKRFHCQTRKIKKMPQDQTLKQKPFDIPFKVWKGREVGCTKKGRRWKHSVIEFFI